MLEIQTVTESSMVARTDPLNPDTDGDGLKMELKSSAGKFWLLIVVFRTPM